MSIEVDTAYLRGFADRIDANRKRALSDMQDYVRAHCLNFAGLDGTLNVAEPGLRSIGEATLDLCTAASNGLGQTAADLRSSANDYDRTDWTAAETMWTVKPQWEVPLGYREADVAGGSAGPAYGAIVTLMAPAYQPENQEAKEVLSSTVGAVNDLIKFLTGYDILATMLPLVVGDWGALKRIGRAYGEMAAAYRAVGADLGEGMNVLSSHWDSTSAGTAGASQAFDYHIRGRWLPAFEALAQMCDTVEQMCESMAAMYAQTVKGLLFATTMYVQKIQKGLKAIMTVTDWKKFVKGVWDVVSSLYNLVIDTITLAIEQVRMFKEGLEMMTATVVMLRHELNGDFDALRTR